MAADALSPAQLHALFDILTHSQTYSEIRDFRDPETVTEYGEPFVRADGKPAPRSATPVLQFIVTTFGLPFVGVPNLSPEFWSVEAQGILGHFADANLSESYDKGAVGTRRTLATVTSSVIEAVARGCLGGHPRHVRIGGQLHQKRYDLTSAVSLQEAWKDVLQELVYGDLIDELVAFDIEEENLEAHSSAVEAAVHYIIIHLATIVHQVLAVSPEGQYLVKLVENLHKLLPYAMIRQTLRMANAATMVNGLVNLLLGKLSIGSITNWLGVTSNADEGLTLLQRIVTMILSWEISDFKKAAEKIKMSPNGPTKDQIAALEEHIGKPQEEQERIRTISIKKQQSIVVAILDAADPSLAAAVLADSSERHTALLEYYSARLSMRDRDEIGRVLCKSRPDLPTQALRDLVAAYDPILREIHAKMPLHELLADLEGFITDFIATCRGKRPAANEAGAASSSSLPQPPSVTDFVVLLQRGRHLLYKWLHRFARDCPDLRETFRVWCNNSIRQFRVASPSTRQQQNHDSECGDSWTAKAVAALKGTSGITALEPSENCAGSAGAMSAALQAMYTTMPPETRAEMPPLLDSHEAYLETLSERSLGRMQAVLDDLKRTTEGSRRSSSSSSGVSNQSSGSGSGGSSSMWGAMKSKSNGTRRSATCTPPPAVGAQSGPGVYLVRWQDLMDEALITASAASGGPLRRGRNVKRASATGKSVTGGSAKDGDAAADLAGRIESIQLEHEDETRGKWRAPPDVTLVIESLGPMFREMLIQASGRDEVNGDMS